MTIQRFFDKQPGGSEPALTLMALFFRFVPPF